MIVFNVKPYADHHEYKESSETLKLNMSTWIVATSRIGDLSLSGLKTMAE
jgi:hypothetical protein